MPLCVRRYGKVGYAFGRGSYNISRQQYEAAVARVMSAPLAAIARDFAWMRGEPMGRLLQHYTSRGAPITVLSELLQRLLAFSVQPAQYDTLWPPPPGWQEPPPFALLLAQQQAAMEAAAAAALEGRPRSGVAKGAHPYGWPQACLLPTINVRGPRHFVPDGLLLTMPLLHRSCAPLPPPAGAKRNRSLSASPLPPGSKQAGGHSKANRDARAGQRAEVRASTATSGGSHRRRSASPVGKLAAAAQTGTPQPAAAGKSQGAAAGSGRHKVKVVRSVAKSAAVKSAPGSSKRAQPARASPAAAAAAAGAGTPGAKAGAANWSGAAAAVATPAMQLGPVQQPAVLPAVAAAGTAGTTHSGQQHQQEEATEGDKRRVDWHTHAAGWKRTLAALGIGSCEASGAPAPAGDSPAERPKKRAKVSQQAAAAAKGADPGSSAAAPAAGKQQRPPAPVGAAAAGAGAGADTASSSPAEEAAGPQLQPPPPAALLSRFGRQQHDAVLTRLVAVLRVRAGCSGSV